MNEAKLLSGLKQNHLEAWELLYGTYLPVVKKSAAWQGWSFSAAEIQDLVQEVFLAFYQQLPYFRGDASLTTYLQKLTRNLCISWLRKKTSQKRSPEILAATAEDTEDTTDPLPLPEEQCLFNLKIVQLKRTLNLIGMECRKLITLRYLEEFSYEEICAKLNLPMGTVGSRLSRCITKLKELLEKNPGFFD